MSDILIVEDKNLHCMHAMAYRISHIDDEAYKCTPKVGACSPTSGELQVLPAVAQEGQRRAHRREHQTTHSGGVFDLRVGEWSVW